MHKHLVRLTPLRFLAAMCVVLFHFGRGVPPFDTAIPLALVSNGSVAVSFFFCLSGFIMASVYGGSAVSPKEYWIARVARIYPLYVLALAMTLLSGGSPSFQATLLNLLMLQSWVPGAVLVNVPGWSLSVEAFFYAIFPLLIRWLGARTIRKLGIITVALWAVTQVLAAQVFHHFHGVLTPRAGDLLSHFPLMNLDQFLLGAVAGALFTPVNQHRAAGHRFSTGALVLLSGVSATYLISGLCLLLSGAALRDLGSDAPVFVGIIWLIASTPTKWARALEWGPLVTLGEASYAIYLLQVPAKTLFDVQLAAFTSRLPPTLHLAAYVAFLIALSLAVYLFIERPCRRWIKEHLSANKDAAPAGERARNAGEIVAPTAM